VQRVARGDTEDGQHGQERQGCVEGTAPAEVAQGGIMIVLTFFVVLIPYRDSSPKLTRSFTELPRCAA
jgi:hypothetical protein